MHIAQIAPLYEAVPPQLYGGTERVAAHLCDALVELGHDVTLFAAAGSRTKARLVAVRDQAIRLDAATLKSDVASHLTMLDEVRRRADEFDILHFHIDMLHLPVFEDQAHRTVTTLHGRLDFKDLPDVYERWRAFGLVSISDQQRNPMPHAHWLATVHHGLPSALYRFNPRPDGGYLAFLGRISPEKRPDLAIQLACEARIALKIAAKVDKADQAYFDCVVKPLLDQPWVEFVGEIGDKQKSAFLGNARALLFPVQWPEPFGLAMIEAMACGTPVIAWNSGSVPEVVDDGVSGRIVSSVEEALAAIAGVDAIDRRGVREAFERRFTAKRMAQRYVSVYSQLLQRRPLRRVS